MFDIGFLEMMLIGVVILVVVGPERLPKVARTAGLWFGKARGFLSSVKADIDSELKADELKRILEEQAKSSGVHEILEESKSAAEDLKQASSDMRKKVSDEQAAIWDERVAENQIQPPAEEEQDYLVKAVDEHETPATTVTEQPAGDEATEAAKEKP